MLVLLLFPVTGFGRSVGQFELVLSDLQRPTNDACVDAIVISAGQPINGDTSASTSESGLDVCGTSLSLGQVGGLWYSFVGTGQILLLAVNSTFDSQLLLYSGSCGALECVDGNDDASELDTLGYFALVEADSIQGQTYHVLGK
jgi:hypothetical protein